MPDILPPGLEPVRDQLLENPPVKWKEIPIYDDATEATKKAVLRLNALGSLFYFSKVVLGHSRLSANLHRYMCSELERDTVRLVMEIPRDHFKAEWIENLIPTPDGFRKMGDIYPGDQVLGVNGMPARVIGTSPVTWSSNTFEVEFSSGEKVIVDGGHLWETDARKHRENFKPVRPCPSVKTTIEIAETLYCRKEHNHRVRVAGAVQLEDKFLLVHPYVLGAWLGDGDSSGSSFTCDDVQIVEEMRKCGELVRARSTKFRWCILGAGARLRKLGVLKNKHIPGHYLRSSFIQRLSLLQGLMDTDGSISKEGQCSFTNMNRVLVDQTRELICSLGLKPSPVGTYQGALKGHVVGKFHVVTFYSYPHLSPFRLERKRKRLYEKRKTSMQGFRQIVSVKPVDARFVKCIMVDSLDGLYLTGEGFIPTHNTTIASVSAPMWWALPFTNQDEDLMYQLGYDEAWMKWMQRAHNAANRTLIASETIQNARKIGVKIDGHYHSNAFFRFLFSSIIPKDDDRWNQDSMTHRRPAGEYHGEGTYDFIGVKGALQSRHYDRQVLDDLVGEKAILSDSVLESTIDWVRKLPGCFDSDPDRPHALADQLFIGNRWSMRDVNSWLRKNVPNLNFISHSAEGGCCAMHPPHQIIFPEEITWEKLAEFRAIFGNYNYAAQMLNNPVDQEAVKFKDHWLRHYSVDVWKEPKGSDVIANWQQLSSFNRGNLSGNPDDVAESQGMTPKRLKVAIKHETQPGETIEDIRAGDLDRFAFMDPNHAEERGRACNAILVVGVYNRPPAKRRIYLLDCWSKASQHEEWLEAALGNSPGKRGLVLKWRCHVLFIESEVAGQSGWKFAIRERMRKLGLDASFSLRPLKTERSANAKKNRIDAMEPVFENGLFWVPRFGCQEWKTEYAQYPNGATMDLMDLTGYIPQCLTAGSRLQTRDFVKEELQRSKIALMNVGNAGY